jgi:hypothetical protein
MQGILLPLVEQIDPALVPELFWRAVAMRPPRGNPHIVREDSPGNLLLLARYDREVAAALFEPVRDKLEHTDDRTLADSTIEFLAWSIFDPRAAVARLEQVPFTPEFDRLDDARALVSQMLGLSYEERWRRIWLDYAGITVFDREIR